MRYTSTRDATKFYTFEEALFSGYAKDGGLFVPEKLPQVNNTTLKEWSKLGYVALSTEVLYPFIGPDQISKLELKSLLERALLNGNAFDTTDDNLVPIVPIVKRRRTTVSNDHDDDKICRCYVAELFHGPTYCFKDLGMRATIFLLDYFATKKNNDTANKNKSNSKKVVLLASTTGDTGPAAVQAVQDLNSPNLSIVIHYPYGQISDFQRKQMTTVQSSRVKIVSFEGGGDDLDRPIKRIMTSTTTNTNTKTKMATTDNGIGDDSNNTIICGVNSYNIGRPLMQMVHFIWTYLRVKEQHIKNEIETKQKDDSFRLDIVIPTGAMGNIAGCYMAKKMGVPFGMLCAGVNINDITHRAFSTGIIQRPTEDENMKQSLSDAINIQLPYNLERLLFYLTNESHDQVKAWYDQLEEDAPSSSQAGCMDLKQAIEVPTTKDKDDTTDWLNKLQTEFRSARVTDDQLCTTMKRVLEDYNYWVDPHTGVAFSAAEQLGYLTINSNDTMGLIKNTAAVALMATAAPCKFQNAVTTALGKEKWEEYEREHFPKRGKGLIEKKEIQPIEYQAEADKTLEENQVVWESKTRELISQLLLE